MDKSYPNQCAACLRFRKWEDLIQVEYNPKNRHDPIEPDSWFECRKCFPEKFILNHETE